MPAPTKLIYGRISHRLVTSGHQRTRHVNIIKVLLPHKKTLQPLSDDGTPVLTEHYGLQAVRIILLVRQRVLQTER